MLQARGPSLLLKKAVDNYNPIMSDAVLTAQDAAATMAINSGTLIDNLHITKESSMKGREHDIEYLVGQAQTLRTNFERLFTPRDWEEIIEIWRKPGWTTPAEFFLVSA